jgi:hypothetical protein
MMGRFDRSAAIAIVAASAAILASGTAAVSARASGAKSCPAVSGIKWAEPGTTKTGNMYAVATLLVSCSTADKLVRGLVGQTVKAGPGGLNIVPKPPVGDFCPAGPDKTHHAYLGRCIQGKTSYGLLLFTWTPKGG